jgi:hypothetical protein
MGDPLGKMRVARAHWGGGTTVGWWNLARSISFGGDGGAMVVGDAQRRFCSTGEEGG